MYTSIAQSRQQLSSLIAAAQTAPQTITKRNKAVAVLVSTDYFERAEAAAAGSKNSFFKQLTTLRASHTPQDDKGIAGVKQPRAKAWLRANPFAPLTPLTGADTH